MDQDATPNRCAVASIKRGDFVLLGGSPYIVDHSDLESMAGAAGAITAMAGAECEVRATHLFTGLQQQFKLRLADEVLIPTVAFERYRLITVHDRFTATLVDDEGETTKDILFVKEVAADNDKRLRRRLEGMPYIPVVVFKACGLQHISAVNLQRCTSLREKLGFGGKPAPPARPPSTAELAQKRWERLKGGMRETKGAGARRGAIGVPA